MESVAQNLQGITPENLLPLDAPELTVRIAHGELQFCHIFRRLTQADWVDYLAADGVESGSEAESRDDARTLALYRRAIVRVEGYVTNTGRKPEQLPDWPACILKEDRLAAIDSLLKIFWVFSAPSVESGRVSFEVLSNEGKPGPLRRYFSVSHRFRAVAEMQFERFFMARGTAVHESESFAALVSLYDELIDEAGGYSFAGRELRGTEEITREMDAFHKVFAVVLLLDSDALLTGQRKYAAALSALGPRTFAELEMGNGKVN